MRISLVRKSRRRSWHVLSRTEAQEFVEKVYAFLALMPERFQAIDVEFYPQWSNDRVWHISGIRGEFALGGHTVKFQFGERTRKIGMTHLDLEEARCSYFVPRTYGSDLNDFVSGIISCLRVSLQEDFLEVERWDDAKLMLFLLKDPRISSAKLFNRLPEGKQTKLKLHYEGGTS